MTDSPTISMGTEVAREASIEPAAKMTAPVTNIRRRPNRSPNRPPVMVRAARVKE
jgi:hypothetical protein